MRLYSLIALAITSTALAAPVPRARTVSLRPLPGGVATLKGAHQSACTPIQLQGKPFYTRLALAFAGARYASSEMIYSDKNCQISVMQTTSQGSWTIREGKVLTLNLDRMQMRPLDPRMADSLAAARTCGKRWENGVAQEILNTPCGKGRQADYFIGASPSGKSLDLYECEGRRSAGAECTHYPMAQADPVKPRATLAQVADKRLKTQASRFRARK